VFGFKRDGGGDKEDAPQSHAQQRIPGEHGLSQRVFSPAPPLTSIGEEVWREFQDATSISRDVGERDTEADIYLHLVADERQPDDIRRRALWSLGSGSGLSGLHLGDIDSEDGSFADSAISTLGQVFESNRRLAAYGTELALEPFENGSYELSSIGSGENSTAILLSAAISHIQDDAELTARSLRAINEMELAEGGLRTRETQITDTAARLLLDPRVKDPIKGSLIQDLSERPRKAQGRTWLSYKFGATIRTAVDQYTPGKDDPRYVSGYFDELYSRIASGEIPEDDYSILPAGVERIAELEAVLGSDHPYVHFVIGGEVFSTLGSHYISIGKACWDSELLAKAEASALKVQDGGLRERAHTAVHESRVRALDESAEFRERRKEALAVINQFFAANHEQGSE